MGGVIFKILKDSAIIDDNTVILSEDNTPYIVVGTGEGASLVNRQRLYFDNYIEESDTYTTSNGFKKYVRDKEESITFQNYYYNLCVEELTQLATNNCKLSLNEFKEFLKTTDFPIFMIKGMGFSVQLINQIDLTESYFNQIKENEIEKRVYDTACATANEYGYRVTEDNIPIAHL